MKPLKLLAVFISTLLFSDISFSQTKGCLFLEGLEIPCYGGGASCECGDYFTEEEMAGACMGTLTPAVTGCGNTCGRACCDTHCSTWNPDEHSVCEVCVDCNTPLRGTIPLSCDDPKVIDAGKNRCGAFVYGCDGGHQQIECQGTGVVQGDPNAKCLMYQVSLAPANSCGRRVAGAVPNMCNGSPTGAPECGGFPDPCTKTSGGDACSGAGNECWTCSFTPGEPGIFEDYCASSRRLCVAGLPFEFNVVSSGCGYICPGGSKPEGTPPPYGNCDEVVSQCSQNSDCP